jgi:tetratricopeptide (TPR) repeat protein
MNEQTSTSEHPPGNTEELLELAELHLRGGDLAKASDLCQQALATDSTNANIYNLLGLIALQTGQSELAKEFFLTAVTFEPARALFQRNLGAASYALGEDKDAENQFRKALELDPEDHEALFNLALILKFSGRLTEALPLLEKSVLARRGDPQPLAQLADLHLTLQHFSDAEKIARAAETIAPNNPLSLNALMIATRYLGNPLESAFWGHKLVEVEPLKAANHANLAKAYVDYGKTQLGIEHARRALQLDPNDAESHCTLSAAIGIEGMWDEALEHTDRAIALNQEESRYLVQKAGLLQRMGRNEEAFELVQPMISGKQRINTDALQIYITLAKRFDHDKEADKLIRDVLKMGTLPDAVRMSLSYIAGAFYDSIGEYNRAFELFNTANSLKPLKYDRAKTEELFDRYIDTFDTELLEKLPSASHGNNKPIFIIGMPRSGTSLAEKIIASHPQVSGAGELTEIHNLCEGLPQHMEGGAPFPECAANLSAEQMDNLAERYLTFIDGLNEAGLAHVTDKMPQNFLFLGMISKLFPEAKIIHCMRNPIDTCLSCYFQNFGAAGLEFSYDLDNLVHYYHQYLRIMEHWEKVLPGRLYHLSYEQLTANSAEEIPKLIEFCGLEWDEACLSPHKSKLVTKTASFDQVRKPIYQSSRERWRNYEKHIKPLIEAFGKE